MKAFSYGFRTAVLSVLLQSLGTGAAAGPEFSGIFVYGDSFSDSGNVHAATQGLVPPDPPYFQGRFSDGRVWVEHLAEKLGLSVKPNGRDFEVIYGNNFAVGGARSAVNVPVPIVGTIPSVESQAGRFVEALRRVPSDALYVVFSGHNDVRFAADPDEGLEPEEKQQVISEAVEGIRTAITALASAGATTVLVPNLADLGLTPEAALERNNAAESTELTVVFNEELEDVLDELEQDEGIKIIRLDMFAFAQEVVEDAVENQGDVFGITNVDTPVFEGYAGSPGAPRDVSLFCDQLHVSAVAHRLLAERAFSVIRSEAGEPAGGQFPGDCNQDSTVDIADAVCLLKFLFLESVTCLPCGEEGGVEPDGPPGSADIGLMDWNGDDRVDIGDAMSLLSYLFTYGPPHSLGPSDACVRITGCPEVCKP